MDYHGDFLICSGVLKEYRGPGGTVIIPEGVKRIDEEAFRNCGDIIGVVLPRGIESIAFKAF